MIKDRYSAVWVSHSSISDYLKCPRSYFLKNMYRDPKTNHKIMLMQPALALGQVVHEVIEALSIKPVEERFSQSLLDAYEKKWETVAGELGGFADTFEEEKFKARGAAMINRIVEHPGPLMRKAIKIRQELPNFWLSENDNIILCGKLDWLEYVDSTDSICIIDFKTGKFDEDPDSLQLPIYLLLASRCQKKPVSGAYYWYIDRDNEPQSVTLPTEQEAEVRVMEAAKKVSLARKLEHFKCQQKDGCRACRPYEAIISGRATFVGIGGYSQDMYVLKK